MVPLLSLQRLEGQALFRGKRFHRDLAEVVGFPGQGDIPPNVRRLQLQFARLHIEAFEQLRGALSASTNEPPNTKSHPDMGSWCDAHPHIGP